MNKYIKAAFCVPLAGIKYVILKLENGKRFHASFPAIMSPLTEVTVEGKSHLCIGKKLKMHNGAKIRVRKGGKLEIGKNFGMSNGCVVTAYDHVKIGDNVMLGPNVMIYDQDHDYQAEGGVAAMKFKTAPITIYPTRATSARYQLDINPTNKNTAADTSIAIQIGEMVCA